MKPETMKLLMNRYRVENLIDDISPEDFKEMITSMIGVEDYELEGYSTPENQRGQSVKFVWGHYHDFGSFEVKGNMQKRHIEILSWASEHGMPTNLSGKKVLDVGCWTGGMSLLLYAMGEPYLIAIDEVKKYINALKYLCRAFGLSRLFPVETSIYNFDYTNTFDLVNFSGVLYHLSDPIVALKILANSMKLGSTMVLETQVISGNDKKLKYVGPTGKSLWSWYFPTVPCLHQMLEDVGLEVKKGEGNVRYRLIAVKKETIPLTQAGLSKRV